MANLLAALQTAINSTISDVTVETVDIQITALSSTIQGKFGPFRQFTLANGSSYNIDDRKVTNAQAFTGKNTASLTIKQFTNSDGEQKTVCEALNIHLPQGSGYFIMK